MSDLITKQGHKLAEQIIKQFEGLRLQAYWDSVRVPTIGWGTTHYPDGRAVALGDSCTEADAEVFFANDLHKFEEGIKDHVPVDLGDNMDAALISFTYNLGLGAFYHSTMLKHIRHGELKAAGHEFPKWCHAGGKVSNGLVRRRGIEMKLFLKGL